MPRWITARPSSMLEQVSWLVSTGRCGDRSLPHAIAIGAAPANSTLCRRTATAARRWRCGSTRGHFGDLSLDGLKWVGLFAWPGAIHEGHGEVQPVIDERASSAQRDALLQILSGQQSEPGTTYFDVFFSTIETVHEPLFLPISFEADIAARQGHFSVPELVEATGEPIRNPMTGAEHRARVALPARLRVQRGGVRLQHDQGEAARFRSIGAAVTRISP